MTYLAVCPACSEEISGGGVCGCGYLHLDAVGMVYICRGEGWPWQPEPNIVVREKTPPEPEPMLEPLEEIRPELRSPKPSRK